jgi:hypothetical protein
MTLTSAINIIPGQKGTYRYLQRRVTDLLAESGLMLMILSLDSILFVLEGEG